MEKKNRTIKEILMTIKNGVITLVKESIFLFRFLFLLFFVFWAYIFQRAPKRKLNKPNKQIKVRNNIFKNTYMKIYAKALQIFDLTKPEQIRDSDLILLALKNLSAKKNRTFVTIGGMAIGFGAVVLLLSTGYGFERLVISQVASLSEMKQIDVSTSQGSPLALSCDVVKQIEEIDGVDTTVPIITSVSKVTYNNAVSDVIAYGVTSRYFEESSIKALKGELFEAERPEVESSLKVEDIGEVAGTTSTVISTNSFDEEIYKIHYAIHPLIWKPVYEKPDEKSKIVGYTKRQPGMQDASQVWGYKYKEKSITTHAIDINSKEYSPWIKDNFELWEKKDCSLKDPNCIDSKYVVMREAESQLIQTGYITQESTQVDRYELTKGSSLEVYSGKVVEDISFSIKPNDYTTLYFEGDRTTFLTTLTDETANIHFEGELVYGEYYDDAYMIKSSSGTKFGYWVKAVLPVWGSDECNNICEKYYTSQSETATVETKLTAYIMAKDVNIKDLVDESIFGNVLGERTESSEVLGENFVDLETLIETDDTIDWVSISSELGTVDKVDKDIKTIPSNAQKVAVVNTSMLTLLGIGINEAVGKSFETIFIYDSKLFDKSNYLVESEKTTYKIVGVTSDNKTPAFYIPLTDIKVDGINNVSQIKVILMDKNDVAEVRKNIESLGFQTVSVVDTVDSISSLFHILRIALLVLGLIALGVASLGMFNTLTVSLLEKTREVGLLKTMGLKSREVKTLFLAESIIMSITGGISGLLLGYLVGKLISILISILALSQGQGMLDVTYIPFMLGAGLVILSSIVGVITGWYPAQRATKVSALNALRYE